MRRALLYGVVALCLSYPALTRAQSMSHEEEVVRNTYAKASTLCSLEAISQAGLNQLGGKTIDEAELTKQLANATPVFTLSGFKTGTILSISSSQWGQLATMPQAGTQILGAGITTFNFSDNGNPVSWHVVTADWQRSSDAPEFIKASEQRSVADTIKLGSPEWSSKPVTYTEYASFTVKLTFQGKAVGPYRALFFFGKDGQGNDVVTPNDAVSNSILWDVLWNEPSYYPTGFVNSRLRQQPVIEKWLQANAIPQGSCTANHELCCSRGRCGISEDDLNQDLATPLPEAKQ